MSLYQTLDETSKPITLLLKGDSGTGKSTKAAQFPKPALFTFDNNLSSLQKLPAEVRRNIQIVDPRKNDKGVYVPDIEIWSNFVNRLERVVADPKIETVILDSLTTMAEILMDKILGSGDPGKRVEIQHWGDFARYMKWLGDHLMCAGDLDKHVIITAHEQLHEEGLSKKVKYLLNVGGQMKSGFDLYFTDCWRTYTKPGKDNTVDYWIRTLPTDYHSAKVSLPLPGDFKWDDKKDEIFKLIAAGIVKKPMPVPPTGGPKGAPIDVTATVVPQPTLK